MNEVPTNGDSSSLKDVYDDYLIRCEKALRDGDPLPALPVELENTRFVHQAQGGLQLLRLLARARDAVMGSVDSLQSNAAPLERVGQFRLVRELGRGGHGVVYLAVDERLGRQVALKLSRPETLLDADLRKRFLREAQAAGQLDHPNLVPVHEVREEGQLFYIAAQYVAGRNLAQWLAEQTTPVPPRQAAELVAALADGVEHAHVHGILHRDIKPSNVLLAEDSGRLTPRLTDFGLAKLLESAKDQTQTRTGVLLGTPIYMAPELASGNLREVGPATDIYGLGALLYEILTGRPPFRGENDIDTIYHTVHFEPLSPQRLRPGLSSELTAICLKCLNKRPSQRYASADQLGADLRRFLSGMPTHARPATSVDRIWKWTKRRPTVAALAGGLAVSLLALTFGSLWYGQRLRDALNQEQAVRRNLEQRDTAAQLNLAQQLLKEGQLVEALSRLSRIGPSRGTSLSPDASFLQRIAAGEKKRIVAHQGQVLAVALAPDGQYLATGGEDTFITLWNVSDGVPRAKLVEHTVAVKTLAFRYTDGALASGGGNGTKGELFIWDPNTGHIAVRLEAPERSVRAVAFSPDGNWLAAAGSGSRDGKAVAQVRIWKLTPGARSDSWTLVHTWDAEGEMATGVAFAADNRTLAVGLDLPIPDAVLLWDVMTGEPTGTLSLGGSHPVTTLTVSADGKHLAATSGTDCCVDLWDFVTRQKLGRAQALYYATVDAVAAAAFHPHCYRLATACIAKPGVRNASSVMVWNADGDCRLSELLGSPGGDVTSLTYTADGRTLLLGCRDGTLRWWNVEGRTLARLFDVEAGGALTVSPDSRRFVGGANDVLFEFDLDSGEKKTFRAPGSDRAHHGEFGQAAVSHDGKLIISGGSDDGRVALWDATTGQQLIEWHAHDHVRSVIASPTSRRAATGGRTDRTICLWDLEGRRQVAHFEAHGDRIRAMAASSDGTFFVSVSADGETKQWSFDTGKLLQTWHEEESDGLWAVAVAPDNQTIAVGADDGTIRIRDLVSGKLHTVMMRHVGESAQPVWLDFSADGRLLASGSENKSLMIWDYRTGTSTVELNCFDSDVDWVGFSRDGGSLFFALRCGSVGQVALVSANGGGSVEQRARPTNNSRPPSGPTLQAASKKYETQQYTAALALLRELIPADAGSGQTFAVQYLRRVAGRELFFFRDQSAGLTCFDLTSDGKQAACGSKKREIRFYDTARGQLGRESNAHKQSPRCLRFVPNTPWMVSGGGYGEQTEFFLWDCVQQSLLERVSDFTRGIRDVAVSPDGRSIAVLEDPDGDAQCVVLWNPSSRKIVKSWRLARTTAEGVRELNRLQFSPDGGQLALAGSVASGIRPRAFVCCLDTATEQELEPLVFDGTPLQTIAISPRGDRLATGGSDGVTYLWEWPQRKLVATIPSAATAMPAFAFSPDGDLLATGYRVAAEPGYLSQVHLWDAESGRHRACVGRLVEGTIGLAFSPDGRTLIQAGDFRSLRKLDLAGSDYRVLSTHQGAVLDLQFADTGGQLRSVGTDGLTCLWDANSLQLDQAVSSGEEAYALAALLPTSSPQTLFFAQNKLWLQEVGRPRLVEHMVSASDTITSMTAGRDGLIALGDARGHAYLWDRVSERTVASWAVGDRSVTAIAGCTDKNAHFAAASRSVVAVWQRDTNQVHDRFNTPDEVRALAMDTLGHVLAAGLRNGQVLLWDVPRRRRLTLADGHFGPITAVAFSPDGQTLASAAVGGDVRLWNARTGEELMPLNAPTSDVFCLRFSADNGMLVAGLGNGEIVAWKANQ